MKFHHSHSSILFDERHFASPSIALQSISHLAIGAHQDDIEIMAMEGIAHCLKQRDKFFGAITCTSGSGSARSGEYSHYTDEQMQGVRKEEQEQAARLGQYGYLAQLGYSSAEVKTSAKQGPLLEDLHQILSNATPDVIYTHNLMDKHDTHIAVVLKVIEVLRSLPEGKWPKRFIGCEVWRGLDWILDSDKVQMSVEVDDQFVTQMVNIFKSQVEGGKRYDLATLGRMHANSTFSESHAVDQSNKKWYGIDLMPLLKDLSLSPLEYVKQLQENLYQDINQRITRYL